MKKYFLLFAAGGLITLASCGGETKPTETINVDSIAAVKADSIAMALQAQTDSTIAAQSMAKADSLTAVLKADSIAAAKAKSTGKKVTTKPTTKPSNPATPPVADPKKPDGLKGHSDENSDKGGLKGHSDQNKPKGGLKSHSDQNR